MRCSDKQYQCIALMGKRPCFGCIVNVFLSKRGMIGRDRVSGVAVQYIPGSTNVWQEVQHG